MKIKSKKVYRYKRQVKNWTVTLKNYKNKIYKRQTSYYISLAHKKNVNVSDKTYRPQPNKYTIKHKRFHLSLRKQKWRAI